MQAIPAAAKRITNFDTDLQDGLALYSVLVNHWAELARLSVKLKQAPADEAQCRCNAEIVVSMVDALQLPYPVQVGVSSQIQTQRFYS